MNSSCGSLGSWPGPLRERELSLPRGCPQLLTGGSSALSEIQSSHGHPTLWPLLGFLPRTPGNPQSPLSGQAGHFIAGTVTEKQMRCRGVCAELRPVHNCPGSLLLGRRNGLSLAFESSDVPEANGHLSTPGTSTPPSAHRTS